MMLQVKVELPFSFKEPSTTTTLSSSFGVSARNVSQPHLYMRQQLLEKASRTTTRTTFFYNIFIPDSQDGQENSLRIVQEQLQQLADSDAVTHSLDQGSTWVLYITIGAENVLTSSWLETNQACPPSLVCKHAGHYRAGTEALTMQLLHDFCRLTDNQHAETTKLVTYIHNKGSFHYSEINENWRYHLTRGATYEDCITHLQKDDCNVCGLRFFPIWTPIFPGNMWTATCPYVASLLSVDDHERSLRKVVSKALLMRLRGHISMNAFKDQQDYLGLARWSKEHWIGSHPNIRACDVNPANKYKEKRGRDQVEFQWSNKPRESAWDAQWLDDDKRVLLQSDEYLQLKEFYFLPGNLMKWFTMYKHAPPDNSNLWKVLPKGAFWKDRVKEFGEKAVEQVLSNPSQWFAKVSPQEVVPKLFTDDRNRRFDALATNAKHGVFYDVYVPEDSGEIHEQALVSQLRIMDDSLGGTGATIYVISMGSEQTNANLCTSLNNLDCQVLTHLPEPYVGEAQRELHGFCRVNPTAKVSYIKNRLSTSLQARDTPSQDLLQHITRAALCKDCLQPSHKNFHCDACGLRYVTLPAMSFAGNMYTAECSYVNQLLEPEVFVEKMSEYVAEVMTLRMDWTFFSTLFDDSMVSMGVDHYAMDQWIASGRRSKPCDVYHGRISDLTAANDNDIDFTLQSAPRQVATLFEDEIDPNRMAALSNGRFRVREVTFIPGLILKWLVLYGRNESLPPWVYDVYPDGADWRALERPKLVFYHQEILLRFTATRSDITKA
jgi:hypothetical protein